MNFTKQYHVVLSVTNPIRICINYEDNVMQILKNKYVNKCFGKEIIVEILEIQRLTNPIMQDFKDHAIANINVEFTAKYIVMGKDDLIANMKIQQVKNSTNITLTDGKNTFICRSADKFKELIDRSENLYIPSTIKSINYVRESEPVIVSGFYFYKPMCIRMSAKVIEDIDDSLAKAIIAKITTFNASIADHSKASLVHFTEDNLRYKKLLSHVFGKYFNNDKRFPHETSVIALPQIKTKQDIIAFYNKIQGKTIFIIPQVEPTSEVSIEIIDAQLENVASCVINSLHLIWAKALEMSRTINEFTRVFTTDEIIAEHRDLWKFYERLIV